MKNLLLLVLILFVCINTACKQSKPVDLSVPIVSEAVVFEEIDGVLAFEAEHFFAQTKTELRKWYITSKNGIPDITPDADTAHLVGVSGGAYIEVLPDTRHTHDDKLIAGENFADKPGELAILHYNVYFNTPGRYFVWIRAYSTNSEDDAVHLGFDGEWPESGMRWRTTVDHQWAWQNKRRYPASANNHGSQISWLDVDKPGQRVLQISMREDGAELDKIILSIDEDYVPEGVGPESKIRGKS
jgi:hypothetical protein